MHKKKIHKTLKKYFIPHRGNKYHPHILHTKRAVLYGAVFVGVKALLIGFALLIPAAAYVAPDVLAEQGKRIIALTNEVRSQKGLPPLRESAVLDFSSGLRATDMKERQYFSHTNPDGHKVDYFLSRAGYRYSTAGENLAMGFSDAESVVAAWQKSSTHYANLVDLDFEQFGVGLEAGEYNGEPTVYVAQHFGAPLHEPIVAAIAQAQTPALPLFSKEGEKESEYISEEENFYANIPPTVEVARSKVRWADNGSMTQVTAEVSINGLFDEASLVVNQYLIPLKKNTEGVYAGSLTIDEASSDLFKVVVPPTVRILDFAGQAYTQTLQWENPKIVNKTPWQTYVRARSWLGSSVPIFSVSRYFYGVAFVFFLVALITSVVIEFRKQHPHVIAQTLSLLALLAVLIRV